MKMTNNTNLAGSLGATDKTVWFAETACYGDAEGQGRLFAGEDSMGAAIPIDPEHTHQIDGREGRWLRGKLFDGVPAAGGGAKFVASVLASSEAGVYGELVYPERGGFTFKGSLMQMGKALHDGGWRGLFKDARLDAWRD